MQIRWSHDQPNNTGSHLGFWEKSALKTLIIKNYQELTRLLGRPQPQMYPPVALNQYMGQQNSNIFYICFKAPCKFWNRFHSKAILEQHVKYSSNLMKICY